MNDEPVAPVGRPGGEEDDRVRRAQEASALMEAQWAELRAQQAQGAPPPQPEALQVRDGFERGSGPRGASPFSAPPPSAPTAQAVPAEAAPQPRVRANGEPVPPSEQRERHDALVREGLAEAHGRLNHFDPSNTPPATVRRDANHASGRGGMSFQGSAGVRAERAAENGQTVYRQTAENQVQAGGSLERPRAVAEATGATPGKVEANHQATVRTRVEVRVPQGFSGQPPSAALALADPRQLPDGGEVRVRREESGRDRVQGSVPLGSMVSAGLGRDREQTAASELRVRRDGDVVTVTRADESRVAVTSGAELGVRPRAPSGAGAVGRAGSVSATGRGELANTRTALEEHTARFDLSTQEGRAAYDRFRQTGEVPRAAGDGVLDVSSRSVNRYQRDAGLTAQGTAEAPVVGRQQTPRATLARGQFVREETETVGPDGARQRDLTVGHQGGLQVRATTRAGETTYEVRLPQVDPLARQNLQAAFGQTPVRGQAPGDVTLRFSEQDFARLADRLHYDQFGRRQEGNPPGARSLMEILASREVSDLAASLRRAQERGRVPIVGALE